jgi:SAM-dependent methyltransferase
MTASRQGVDPFDADAAGGEGYLYTTAGQFSSRHVLGRHMQLILGMARMQGKSVVDIGCGDGFSTFHYWDGAHPARMAGVDPAPNAIKVANSKRGERPIEFRVLEDHHVPFDDASFDLAIVQGVLHHADEPQTTIREALRVAREVVILEPNGLNLGLKLVERAQPYHRQHNERSYTPRRLRSWVEAAGGRVTAEKFGVCVPIFSPGWLARPMAVAEPVVEAIPGLRAIGCSVYVMRATHSN